DQRPSAASVCRAFDWCALSLVVRPWSLVFSRSASVTRRLSRRSPELSKQTYLDHIQNRYGIESEGMLTDFLSQRDKRLLLADRIDLSAMVERYGAPLEIAYCPLITNQVERMLGWAAAAREE